MIFNVLINSKNGFFEDLYKEAFMEHQTYFNYPIEADANVCNNTDMLVINCAGVVDALCGVNNTSVRRDYYLMYITEGKMHIRIGSSETLISEGEMLIIAPGTSYHYHTEAECRINYLWIHFSGSDAGELPGRFGIELNRIYNTGVHHIFNDYWKRLFAEFVRNDAFFDTVSACILTEILASFSRFVYEPSDKKNFAKSVTYIHQNYSKNINIASLAQIENLSEPHYRTCFRKIYNMSPVEYITDVRIHEAARLLESTEKKLSEIAKLCGYEDVYYFIRVFTSIMGISPGRYRKNEYL